MLIEMHSKMQRQGLQIWDHRGSAGSGQVWARPHLGAQLLLWERKEERNKILPCAAHFGEKFVLFSGSEATLGLHLDQRVLFALESK